MDREDFDVRVLEADEFSEATDGVFGRAIITRIWETKLRRERSEYDNGALGLI